MIFKPYFVFDENVKSKLIKKKILKKYKHYSLNNSNLIVVFGGDGFMLHTLKHFKDRKKPFYGINTGTYGFLMNKISIKNLNRKFSKANPVIISPLEMVVQTKKHLSRKSIAINEISMFRQSKQAVSLSIKRGNRIIMKKLISDGVLVSTPAGSTAYNLSVHGPILSLNSGKLAITPISPFRPRRWRGSIVSDKSIIHIKNLNTKKRPLSVVADNSEVRNAIKVKIYINKKIKFTLLYDPENSLNKKIKIEQTRKEIK